VNKLTGNKSMKWWRGEQVNW